MSVLLPAAVPAGAAGQPSIESRVFQLINSGRSGSLIRHAGLVTVARNHSRDMAARRSLDHAGVDARMRNVPPDPPEPGSRDTGTTGWEWCENVTYVTGVSEAEVADRIYGAWRRSSSHNRCLHDSRMNVGGVGVHFDGQTWWATFGAMLDRTPPGGAPETSAPRTEAPPPTQPARTEAPPPTQQPERTSPPPQTAPPPSDEPPRRLPSTPPLEDASSLVGLPALPVVRSLLDVPDPVGPAPAGAQIRSRSGEGRQDPAAPDLSLPGVAAGTAAGIVFGWGELGSALALIALGGELLRRISRRSVESEMT